MSLVLEMSYDRAFVDLLHTLRLKYPEQIFRLEGIHPDQLDINKTSRAYFSASGRKGSAVADQSIDPNANVGGRDVITYNYEVPKPLMKLNSLYNLWLTLRDVEGEAVAARCLEKAVSGVLYINDAWDIGRPYCFNFSTHDIAMEGLKMGGRLDIDPPKSLASFLRQVEQFVVYAANSILGATGLADLLITASWYVDRILQTGMDHKIRVADKDMYGDVVEGPVWTYVAEALTSLIYTLNWEFRGNQSPFTNVSVYDDHFLKQLLPAYALNGQPPDIHTVRSVQRIFLETYNEILSRTPITFPVVTACFTAEEDGEGKRVIKDQAFLQDIAEHNLKYGCINIYCGETSTLSSCCRLRSDINDLGYSNTFGAGSTKIGSLGVTTINLPRLARTANRFDHTMEIFTSLVASAVDECAAVNNAKRVFIKDRITRGALPLYSLGYMHLSRQFSTCGFTGLYEAAEILMGEMSLKEYTEFCASVLAIINNVNETCAMKYSTPHNMEQVPGESSAVKLAKKDLALGHNPEGYELYSNQFLPLWQEDADVLDRIKVQGALDKHCTGGAVCHLNIAAEIRRPETMAALIQHAASQGVVYFAVNYQINRCAEGHMTVGRDADCSVCGKPVTDVYTRVVGFLTNVKHWSKTRREHDWPERRFASC